MPKTGLKTFVYSFSVSLFAIFAANGVYRHNFNPTPSDIKIPAKNVTLFLKSGSANPSNLAVPVKKIALSVLPEIASEHKLSGNDEIIMADAAFDNLELPTIPLEIETAPLDEPSTAPAKPLLLADNTALTAATKAEPLLPDRIEIPLQAPDIAPEIRPTKVAQNKVSNPVAAPAAKPQATVAVNEPIPLLPLEKSGDALAQSSTRVNIGNPEKLNQVALADKNIPIQSMEKAIKQNPEPTDITKQQQWQSMADKSTTADDTPWLVAKADGALKNRKIAEEDFYQKENAEIRRALNPQPEQTQGVKVAAETVKNLLIPIPQDILDDENLTPQLSYTPKGKAPEQTPKIESTPITSTATAAEDDNSEESRKNRILSSLNSIFKANSKIKEDAKPAETPSIIAEIRKKLQKTESMGKIMPTEMRLSFQPNRAEISGQTLRWIQAFATRAANDQNMSIEIRIDGTGAMELQQKRLNLLHNILTNKGVEYSKINTVFTQREPNSFIIKTISYNRFNQRRSNGNINKTAAGYYQQW